jgi:hypothetical protein
MSVTEWVLIAIVAVGVVAALFGFDRYRNAHKAGGDAQPTGEVFTDPVSGKQMRVWYNPANGEREYRPD